MPRDPRHLLFVGIYNSVLALDTRDGSEVWRTKLGGVSFVNVYWDGEELFASSKGECIRLDPKNGAIIWHNKLSGLGYGIITLATTRSAGAGNSPAGAAQVIQARRAAQSAG